MLAAALLGTLFASYGILKPLRDNVGQYFGRELLPRIWLGTAVVTVLATALLGAAVSRFSRRRFAPWAFASFALVTGATWLGYRATDGQHGFWLPAAFYWWVSSYLMVGLALFWGMMADLHGPTAGKRWFGPIAFGGTLGNLGGAKFTQLGAERLGLMPLLGIAVLLLAAATGLCVLLLARTPQTGTDAHAQSRGVGGKWWQGFAACVRSPYLGGILAYVALQTFASAVLSLEVLDAVKAHFGDDQPARTAFNASLDFWTQTVTLGLQLLVVGPLMQRFGTGVALAVQPLAYAIGFVVLPFARGGTFLAAIACFEVGRRSANYGLAKPGRDALFTVCAPADKYKAKSVIDAAGFRVCDYVFGETTNLWRKALARVVGSGIGAAAVVTVPIALAWAGLAVGLGRMQARRASAAADAATPS